MFVRAHVRAPGAQVPPEGLAACVPGNLAPGDIRIAQAEGHEHRAPVVVVRAVPVAVAGVALRIALRIDDEIAVALAIAQLGARDGRHILPPVAAQLHAPDAGLPLGAGLGRVPGDSDLRAAGGFAAQRVGDSRREARRTVDRRDANGRAALGFKRNRLLRKHVFAGFHDKLHAVRRKSAADECARADLLALEGPGGVRLHVHAQLGNHLRHRGVFRGGFRRGFRGRFRRRFQGGFSCRFRG